MSLEITSMVPLAGGFMIVGEGRVREGRLRTGERCKTHLRGRITQPHQDRWTQWHLAGSPGAWWHGEDGRDGYQRQPPVGSREDLLDGISKSLALIERNISELRRLNDAK